MTEKQLKRFNRRTFLKYAGAGALALSLPLRGPWVLSQQPFLIGMANPLASFFGQAAEKALRLGINEINAQGGIMGRPLDLIVSDTAGRSDQAPLALQDLAGRGAQVLTGFFFSEALIGALGVIPLLRKLVLGTGSSTPAATIKVSEDYENFKFFFRFGPVNSFLILQIVITFTIGFLERGLGWNAIALFAEDAAWTKPITDGFPLLLKAAGSKLEIPITIRYAEDTTDFTPLFRDMVAAMEGKVGGIFTVMAHTGTRPTAQWADQQVPLPLVGVNVQAQDSRFDALTEGAAESVVTLTSAARAPITGKTIPFVDAFAAFTEFLPEVKIPSYNAFHSYDGLYLLKKVIEDVGVFPDTEEGTAKVIEEMASYGSPPGAPIEEMKLFEGTAGMLGFYQRGEAGVVPAALLQAQGLPPDQDFPHDVRWGPGLAEGLWIQWQGGKQEVIFPPHLATAQFVLPPWLRG
jgi:branched-chain amino acid transport system substrate-binding protein